LSRQAITIFSEKVITELSSKVPHKIFRKSSFDTNILSQLFHAAQLLRVIIVVIAFQKRTKNESNKLFVGFMCWTHLRLYSLFIAIKSTENIILPEVSYSALNLASTKLSNASGLILVKLQNQNLSKQTVVFK